MRQPSQYIEPAETAVLHQSRSTSKMATSPLSRLPPIHSRPPLVVKSRTGGFHLTSKRLNFLLFASIPIVLISVGLCYYLAGLATPPVDPWTPIYKAESIQKMVLQHHVLSTYFKTNTPMALDSQELEGRVWCSFKTRTGLPLNCREEWTEHRIIHEVIGPESTVLELGSRLGTLSCEIAKIQNNSGRLLAVEADKDLWSVLYYNQLAHECSFSILLGTISQTPFQVTTTLEGDRIIKQVPKEADSEKTETDQETSLINSLSFQKAQDAVRMKFDTILLNCDGCAAHFLEENFQQLSKVKVIIIETTDDIASRDCQDLDCVELKTWILRLQTEWNYHIKEISEEQNYALQLIPSKKVYHYVLIKE